MQPLIPAGEKWVLSLKCLHGQLHIIALPKSHSEFKGSSLDDWGADLLIEEKTFFLCWHDAQRARTQGKITTLQPKIKSSLIYKPFMDGLFTVND